MKHRGAHRGRGDYFGPFASAGRSTARSTRCSAPSCCAPARIPSTKAAPGRACSTRSSAAPGRAPARSSFPDYTELVREATDFLSGRSRRCADWRATWRRLPPSSISNARRCSRPPRRAVGHPVAAGHQSAQRRRGRRVRHPSAGRPVLHRGVLLPHRPELGQPRLFPEGRPSLQPDEVLGAFLAQFYDDKPPPH